MPDKEKGSEVKEMIEGEERKQHSTRKETNCPMGMIEQFQSKKGSASSCSQ